MIMSKILKNNYLFIILFLLILLKEPIYKLFTSENNVYNTILCQFLEEDYNRLLKFSEIDVVYKSEYVNTFVIYKDIYNYMNEITIRGGLDKDFNNNPVIYNNTLVGFISTVHQNSSKVKLITNKNSKVSVKINDEVGIMEYINGKLIVSNISNYGDIKIGDSIYTSGLGNIKENIFIGEVSNIDLDSKNIEQLITVSYKLNIKDINYVTVLKESL